MKCWTIYCGGAAELGIRLKDNYIRVGEAGRGRHAVDVPVPAGSVIEDDKLLEVPGSENGAVILIRDQSGYRGGWYLGYKAETMCPNEGQRIDSSCPICKGWVSHSLLPIGKLNPQTLGKLIAEGYCAQGAAGRMGGGPEYLVVARFGAEFSIRRQGRLYGNPDVLNVSVTPEGIKVTDARWEIESRQASEAWKEDL